LSGENFLHFLSFKKGLIVLLLLLSGFQTGMGMVDENGNGVSDVWEGLYGPLTEPDEDPDGDGFTNREEAEAGMNPNDAEDAPVFTALDTETPRMVKNRFKASAGIQYRIFASPDLLSWFPAGPSVRGIGNFQEVIFDTDEAQATGTALRSVWQGLSGGNLNTIKGYAGSGTPEPDIEEEVTRLSFVRSDPDESNFGQWIRGWIVPKETGEYTFWVSGDDDVELWLSTDSRPENGVLTAYVDGWTGFQEWTKFPEQRSAPVVLQAGSYYYFEVFHREWSGGDHLSVGWTTPGEAQGSVEILSGDVLSTVGTSLGALLEQYGRLFFRLEASQVDTDGDGLTDFEEEVLGLNADRMNSRPRTPDYEEAMSMLQAGHTVSIGVSRPRGYESTGDAAELVVFRAGSIEPLTLNLSVTGSAQSGVDFSSTPSTLEIPGGARAVFLPIQPLSDALEEGQESVTVTLQPGTGYVLGSPSSATVTLDDAPDQIYQAQLRPPEGNLSAANGTLVLRAKGNVQEAWLSLGLTGLESTQTGAELIHSLDGGLTGTVLYSLPLGAFADQNWDLTPAAGLSKPEFLVALSQGDVWVRIRTSSSPDGELLAPLVTGASQQTTVPAPEAADSSPSNEGEVSRFMLQATFGPTIQDVEGWGSTTFEAWMQNQMSLPATYHMPYVQARVAERLARGDSEGGTGPRQEAFWQHAVTAEDQLRQRMAFALSQIFVVSQIGGLDSYHEGVTQYYDMLLEHSFGNYRDLLEAVTLSPVMGTYLSMIRNRKPDWDTGHEPDENYAREIMQLFSIGLVELHPDGTVKHDEEGNPIPTYTQEDIVGLAHVFTGWGPYYDDANPPQSGNGTVLDRERWFLYGRDMLNPMTFYPQFHDEEDRTIVGGVTLAGDLGGEQRMQQALDTLFYHPNVGPFMAKRLIQRFVTSNPSPAYIYRVAQVFNDNGSGVRGDLGAVIQAVLLDPEARNQEFRNGVGRGRPVEPILRITRLLRAAPLQLPRDAEGDDRLFLNLAWGMPEQAPLLSPSVFNFFQPEYSNPGAISNAGLDSPEFQILSETTGMKHANILFSMIFWGTWTPEVDAEGNRLYLELDLTPWITLLENPALTESEREAVLIDRMNEVLFGGSMSADLRQNLVDGFNELPSWYGLEPNRLQGRVEMALYILMVSADAFILR